METDETYHDDDPGETEYEDDDSLADIPYEDVVGFVGTLAEERAQAREAEAEANYDPWEDQSFVQPWVEELEMVERGLGRDLTSREISALQKHTEATGQGPLDAEGVLKDPELNTDEGRRAYIADRLKDSERGLDD